MGCKGSRHASDQLAPNGAATTAEIRVEEVTEPETPASSRDQVDKVAPDQEQPGQAQTPPANARTDGEGQRRVDEHGRRTKQSQSVPPNFFREVSHNGFKVINEAPAFTTSEGGLAPYTLPVEVLTYVPPEEVVITQFANGDSERKIHCNIRLSPNELERLQAMRAEAKVQGASFFPSVTAMATRFLSRARMDPKKAVKLMRETQDWRASYFADGPVREEEVREDMKTGICYFCGRDSALRPCIIIRPARIPSKWYKERSVGKLIRILIFCMEYFLRYMVVPGRIENLSVIVDLAGLGMSQVPIAALQEVYKVMSHHYIGRVYKFYVCNVSAFLSTMAGMVKSILTDRQKQKLNVLDDTSVLLKEFACHQLEPDIGGSRAKIEQFYPFPMTPGPYTAGFKGEPVTNSVGDVHNVLSTGGSLGRLWNPKDSDDHNIRLGYGPKAMDVLTRCNLPVPNELRMACEVRAEMGAGQEAEEETLNADPGGKLSGDVAVSNVDNYDTMDMNCVDETIHTDEVPNAGPQIESSKVCGSMFSCCRGVEHRS